MSMLLGPDSSARLVYVPSATFASAAGQVATVYAAATGSTLAVIRTYDGTSTPGAIIPGSQVTVNADSQIPLFWYPDNVDTVWIQVGTGTRTETPASLDMQLDRVSGGIEGPLIGTGLLSGGQITVNAGNPQAVDIAPFVGYIVDYITSPTNPTTVRIERTTTTTVALDAGALARLVTWLLIDSSGNVVQQATQPTNTQRRTHIQLGAIVLDMIGGSIVVDQTLPVIINNPLAQLYDLFYALGTFSISGNIISANGANLTFNKSAGVLFAPSFDYFFSGALTNDPYVSNTAAETPATFVYATQTNPSVGAFRTTIDVANYDVGGVVTPIGGGTNTSSIHRVFEFAIEGVVGQTVVQYGQATYSSLSAATAAIGRGTYVVNPSFGNSAALIGFIVATRTATNLSDPSQAAFVIANRFQNP